MKIKITQIFSSIALVLVLSVSMSGCSISINQTDNQTKSSDQTDNSALVTDPNNIPRTTEGSAESYIPANDLPDSSKFLSLPPANGTPEKATDQAVAENMTTNYYGTDRWLLSALDAELSEPKEACHFNCAIGVTVSPEETPHLYTLLVRSASTASSVANAMKKAQMRQRPFAQAQNKSWGENSTKTCRQDSEAFLKTNGSYPSGHTSIGYTMGLVLASIDPNDSTKIIQRARQYAESRVVCNVHWLSDTQAGREVAATTLSQLVQNDNYKADFEAAKEEFDIAKAKGEKPTKTYQIESETKDSSDITFVDDINKKFLNWDCDKEEAVLANFNVLSSN